MVRITQEDLDALRAAAAKLEHPSLAARLGNIAGKPIELVGRALPEAASKAVATATTKALEAALAVALRTMEKEPKAASRLLHKAVAAASGAVGGGCGRSETSLVARARIFRTRRAPSPASKYSPWGRAMARRMRWKADISLSAG